MPLKVSCTAALTSFSHSVCYITCLFTECPIDRFTMEMLYNYTSIQFDIIPLLLIKILSNALSFIVVTYIGVNMAKPKRNMWW